MGNYVPIEPEVLSYLLSERPRRRLSIEQARAELRYNVLSAPPQSLIDAEPTKEEVRRHILAHNRRDQALPSEQEFQARFGLLRKILDGPNRGAT